MQRTKRIKRVFQPDEEVACMAETSRDQLLVLKVMRLARPKLYDTVCIPIDPGDPMSELIGSALCRLTGQQAADEPVGEYLMAPQIFDNIYLGETFTFYVCVQNDSNQYATEICIKTDLQTTNQRVALHSKLQDSNATLQPGEILGDIISHEIKEVGQHILVCAVTYKTPADEKMYFRKFFKFPVTKPIDVRTKFYNAENNDVYLEAQIQNTSATPMILEKVVLEPSDFYTSIEIPPPVLLSESSKKQFYLNPKDIRQYLYCLRPKTADYSLNYYRGGTSIGKLDMVWRTSMGERGRLQTSALQRMAPGYGDLRLTVERIPATAKIRQAFEVVCRLHNCSERSLDLVLTLDGSLQPALIFCTASGVQLGQLPPNNTVDFTLELLPITPGLQPISGIRVSDTFLKRTYEHDDIAQVFVT
uniref:Trafficking protein particle complex subunit 13 n=2 Tax=Parascaris univalens TaxID=6257 RepID=A0A915AJ06_PARUN